jgi:hypothetical protein
MGVMRTMQTDIKTMQSEIKGLQLENRRIFTLVSSNTDCQLNNW